MKVMGKKRRSMRRRTRQLSWVSCCEIDFGGIVCAVFFTTSLTTRMCYFADQMLKERFLNTGEEDVFEENFTDDEESEDEADGAGELLLLLLCS